MIRVFPSMIGDAEPIEAHEHSGTFDRWMRDNVEDYTPGDDQPIVVSADGEIVPPKDWEALQCDQPIDVHVKPQGDVLSAIGGIVSSVVDALFGWAMPSAPKSRASVQGDNLSPAEARANIARINESIPEGFGRYRRYPDYLLPPVRRFVSPREQELNLLLCCGVGEYDVPVNRVLVGETPLVSLGGDVQFQLYAPGDDLSSDDRAEWWYTAPEVGATAKGNPGLDLKATFDIPSSATGESFIFDTFDVTATGGSAFPTEWASSLVVRIEAPRTYTVGTGGTGGRNTITGNFSDLEPFTGMLIEITGENDGLYVVHDYDDVQGVIELDYDNDDPVIGLLAGSRAMTIGYRGLRYQVTAASTTQISVERLTDTGSIDSGWGGFTNRTVTGVTITLDGSTLEGDWAGPFAACPEGETTSVIEWDYFFPSGLIRFNSSGSGRRAGVDVEVQYRDMALGGTWTTVPTNFFEGTLDQIGFTIRHSLPYAMRPELRARRLTAESESTRRQDKVQLYGLRSLLSAPTVYPGVTALALKIIGSGKLAAQSEDTVSIEGTRILPRREGGVWLPPAPTRSIVDAVSYIAKSVGMTDAQLDLAEFDRLQPVWNSRGDWFDYAFTETTMKDAINVALGAGFAEMTRVDGLLGVARDEPRTQFEQMYTPQNYLRGGLRRSFEAIKDDDMDGVDVEYMDERTWTTATIECRLPGDLGLRVEKLKVDGVIDRTRAWRIGMRRRRELAFRRWSYDFSTELDALNSRYLSYVALSDDVPGYGQSALLRSIDGQTLHVTEPLRWEAGPHMIGIRNPDGTMNGPYAATPGSNDFEVVAQGLSFQMPPADYEPPHILFGPVNRWTYPSLITEITPNGLEQTRARAVNYDARVYADDDNSPS